MQEIGEGERVDLAFCAEDEGVAVAHGVTEAGGVAREGCAGVVGEGECGDMKRADVTCSYWW
jgi:hypothetical protein